MIVNGKTIAERVKERVASEVRDREHRLRLGVVVVQQTPEIELFVRLKKKFGDGVGIDVDVRELDPLSQTNESFLQSILDATREYDGLVVQLPLPHGYDREQLFRIFPLSHDVDVIGDIAYTQFREGNLPFLPPVIGAFDEILQVNGVGLAGRNVLVVGEGRLVGAPAAQYAAQRGGQVVVANKETPNLAAHALNASVIMLGAGAPGILTPDMVTEETVVLDAGTSEEAGVVKGDADPAVGEKAALFTPTPGGVGPITVAKLFENLITLDKLKERNVR